jgi:Fe-S cluster assembly protein SufD
MEQVLVEILTADSRRRHIAVEKNSDLTIIFIALGSVDFALDIELCGTGSTAKILGIVIGSGSELIKINTLQKHTVAHTVSDLHIKTVLAGNAHFAYDGIIAIDELAQQSNAYQRNDTLLLSPNASAETKPALEIKANDVRCTHGATLGRIDQESVFYLRSRGLSSQQAESLITEGFLLALTEKIADAQIRAKISKKIIKHLSTIEELRYET